MFLSLFTKKPSSGIVVLPDCRHGKDVPLHGHVELREVDAQLDDVGALDLAELTEIDLEKIFW